MQTQLQSRITDVGILKKTRFDIAMKHALLRFVQVQKMAVIFAS